MFFTSQRDREFYDLIENAARNAHEMAELLFHAVDDLAHIAEHARRAKELESRGDEFTHRVIELLNRTFVTPLEREDLFALAVTIDDVADEIEAAMSRMAIYDLTAGNGYLKRLAGIVKDCTGQIREGVTLLRKRNLGKIRDYAVRLNELENDADSTLREALAELFRETTDAVRIIKLKEIYETLEEATDFCEDVANTLESVAMRHA